MGIEKILDVIGSHQSLQNFAINSILLFCTFNRYQLFAYNIYQTGIEEALRLLKMKQQQATQMMSSSAAPPPPATLCRQGRLQHLQQQQQLGDAGVSGLSATPSCISAARPAAATGFPYNKYIIGFSTEHHLLISNITYNIFKRCFSTWDDLGTLCIDTLLDKLNGN